MSPDIRAASECASKLLTKRPAPFRQAFIAYYMQATRTTRSKLEVDELGTLALAEDSDALVAELCCGGAKV